MLGKEKYEVGVIVAAKYGAFTLSKKLSMVLDRKISKAKVLEVLSTSETERAVLNASGLHF